MENSDSLFNSRRVPQAQTYQSTNDLKIVSRYPEIVPNGILKPETYYKTKRNILAVSVENDTKYQKYKSILKHNFIPPPSNRDVMDFDNNSRDNSSTDNYQTRTPRKTQQSFVNDVVYQDISRPVLDRAESNKSPYKSVLPPIKDFHSSSRKLPTKKVKLGGFRINLKKNSLQKNPLNGFMSRSP